MVQTRYLQLAVVMLLWGMVGVAAAQAQTTATTTTTEVQPPPAATDPGFASGAPGGPVSPDIGVSGSPSTAPPAAADGATGVSPSPGPLAAPSAGPGYGAGGPPSLLPLAPPMSPLALRRFRTGRALYGVGTALGLVGSGLTVASIIVTAVYGLDASSGQSTALIGPSLAYAGSGATGAGFIFGATGLGLQHSALDLVGRDPGRGMYAAGTLFGILGLCGIGTSYFFGLTHVVDHSTEIAFGTSIAASAFLTIGGLLYFSDINRLAAAYRRLTTF